MSNYRLLRYLACFLDAQFFAAIEARCTPEALERSSTSFFSCSDEDGSARYIIQLFVLQSQAKQSFFKAAREVVQIIEGNRIEGVLATEIRMLTYTFHRNSY